MGNCVSRVIKLQNPVASRKGREAIAQGVNGGGEKTRKGDCATERKSYPTPCGGARCVGIFVPGSIRRRSSRFVKPTKIAFRNFDKGVDFTVEDTVPSYSLVNLCILKRDVKSCPLFVVHFDLS